MLDGLLIRQVSVHSIVHINLELLDIVQRCGDEVQKQPRFAFLITPILLLSEIKGWESANSITSVASLFTEADLGLIKPASLIIGGYFQEHRQSYKSD